MVQRRPQVLPEGDEVHSRAPQVGERGIDLGLGLTESQHEAALGEYGGAVGLGVRQHRQRLLVARARIAHRMCQSAHCLDVLRKHLDAGIDHRLDVRAYAAEVRRQRLDGGGWIAALDRGDAGRVMRRAPIGQIVAVDRGEHHVA
jgi:hypothetical protein